METSKLNLWNRPDRIPEIYGTLITLALIVYFFAMYAVGLVQVIELRLLNLFIMLGGIYLAHRQYKRTHAGHLNYFRAMAIGVYTAVIGATTFAAFLMIFLLIDHNLMAYIIEHEPMGRYLNPYISAAAVAMEGTFSGVTMTYLLLNFAETDKATEPIY